MWGRGESHLGTAGQDEIVLVLECLPDEKMVPKDIFTHLQTVYEEASKGRYLKIRGERGKVEDLDTAGQNEIDLLSYNACQMQKWYSKIYLLPCRPSMRSRQRLGTKGYVGKEKVHAVDLGTVS